MQINEFKNKLKSRNFHGCYVFSGEEDYLKRHYLKLLRDGIISDEAFLPFNYVSFDERDIDYAKLRDAVISPPMMSDYKLVECRYPRLEKMKEEEIAELENILMLVENNEYAVLVFFLTDSDTSFGTQKRPSALAKKFDGRLNVLYFDKSSEQSLLSWLKKHFDAEGVRAGLDALNALLFRSGHSMTVLNNEVIKLASYAKANGKTEITKDDVNSVASSCPESDTFALSNAVLQRNKKLAFTALDEMKRRRLDPIMIMGMLSKLYSEFLTVSTLVEGGESPEKISELTGIKGYPLELYINASKRCKPKLLMQILSELSRVDISSKFGGISGYCAIEIFISKCV